MISVTDACTVLQAGPAIAEHLMAVHARCQALESEAAALRLFSGSLLQHTGLFDHQLVAVEAESVLRLAASFGVLAAAPGGGFTITPLGATVMAAVTELHAAGRG